jgi:hypothetical protein
VPLAPAPPCPDDHAIVIGVRRYADKDAGWITDLEGPDNDVAAIVEWLQRADGGGLPAANVQVISSASVPDPWPDTGAEPHQSGIVQALTALAQLPKGGYQNQWAGRRLYVYACGHGFSRERWQAGLVTAEATKTSPANVEVASWVSWMSYAAPFQQLVLWADMCAVNSDKVVPQRCGLARKDSGNLAKVELFQAFAAELTQTAVEAEMKDGKVHGAFTYALLQALNGAATGAVDSDSLQDYLINNTKSFMTPEQRERAEVAKEPRFLCVGRMSFAPLLTPTSSVTLTFPPSCVGRVAIIGTNRSSPPTAATVLATEQWTLELQPGYYAVYVEGPELATPFAVSGGGESYAIAVP